MEEITYLLSELPDAILGIPGGGGGSYDKYADIPELYQPYVEQAKAFLAEDYPEAAYTDIIISARPSVSDEIPFSYLYIYFATPDFAVDCVGANGSSAVHGCYCVYGWWSATSKQVGASFVADGYVWYWSFSGGKHTEAYLSADRRCALSYGDDRSPPSNMGRIVYSSTYIHYLELLLYPTYATPDVAASGHLTYTWEADSLTLTIYADSASELVTEETEES